MGLNAKELSFWAIGVITLVYCVIELGVAVWKHSLTLMSDGFHNLSDVISLYIAFWASRAAKRDASDEMSYGWARTELLGGLTNGVFLVSLSLYIVLEAIPEFIEPQSINKEEGLWYIGIAAGGLLVNTIGTVVFAITGQSHGHSHAHGHSHGGGGDHGHSHGGDDHHDEEHGHGHGHGGEEHGHGHGEKKKKKHGHGHSHGEEDDHGHGHGHGETHDDDHGHGHGHGEKKKKKHGHGHSHGDEEHLSLRDLSNDSAHASDALLPEKKQKKKKKRDMNVHAVFLHYLGDMLSSFFVLVAGCIMYFALNHPGDDGIPPTWPEYIDPSASLVIVILILVTTVPLVKRCAYILLQSTPSHLDLKKIRHDIKRVDGVLGLHDFHVWQLVDGMVIASIHVKVQEGCEFGEIARKIKKIFHRQGIHSTAIQPEFAAHPMGPAEFCEQNCVDDCKEEWCCKKVAEKSMAQLPLAASTPYNSLNHL